MFKGFAHGCVSEGYDWSLQLSALSSYAPVKVWNIDQFAYCQLSNDGSTEQYGFGKVHSVEIPDAFTQIVPEGVLILEICMCGCDIALTQTHTHYHPAGVDGNAEA
jgi:hypothetical protein